jgi:hypothetical protein
MQHKAQLTCKLRQFTWLFLGLCFAILYSCPVKKFLIIHFDKVNAPVSASDHVDKSMASRNTRIAYLNRNNFSYYKIPGSPVLAEPPGKPLIPDWNFLLSALLLFLGLSYLHLSYLQTKRVLLAKMACPKAEGSPPLYLRYQRLQI